MLFLPELKQVLVLVKQFSFINRNVSLKHILLTRDGSKGGGAIGAITIIFLQFGKQHS